mmetsp:Transcript_46649/g.129798  ORF Transcript_46649/g.129798 Transcript_46649/m.129798 type:complete len:333 (+) Transcript_46649:103-1101(+)
MQLLRLAQPAPSGLPTAWCSATYCGWTSESAAAATTAPRSEKGPALPNGPKAVRVGPKHSLARCSNSGRQASCVCTSSGCRARSCSRSSSQSATSGSNGGGAALAGNSPTAVPPATTVGGRRLVPLGSGCCRRKEPGESGSWDLSCWTQAAAGNEGATEEAPSRLAEDPRIGSGSCHPLAPAPSVDGETDSPIPSPVPQRRCRRPSEPLPSVLAEHSWIGSGSEDMELAFSTVPCCAVAPCGLDSELPGLKTPEDAGVTKLEFSSKVSMRSWRSARVMRLTSREDVCKCLGSVWFTPLLPTVMVLPSVILAPTASSNSCVSARAALCERCAV